MIASPAHVCAFLCTWLAETARSFRRFASVTVARELRMHSTKADVASVDSFLRMSTERGQALAARRYVFKEPRRVTTHFSSRSQRIEYHPRWFWIMGRRRRRLGVRVGTAGRCGVSGDDAARDRSGRQLDRHCRSVRARAFGGGRRAAPSRVADVLTGPSCSRSAVSSGTTAIAWRTRSAC